MLFKDQHSMGGLGNSCLELLIRWQTSIGSECEGRGDLYSVYSGDILPLSPGGHGVTGSLSFTPCSL